MDILSETIDNLSDEAIQWAIKSGRFYSRNSHFGLRKLEIGLLIAFSMYLEHSKICLTRPLKSIASWKNRNILHN